MIKQQNREETAFYIYNHLAVLGMSDEVVEQVAGRLEYHKNAVLQTFRREQNKRAV